MAQIADKSMEIKELDTVAGLDVNYRYEKFAILEQASIKEISMYSSRGDFETSSLTKSNHYFGQIKTILEELTKIIKGSGIEPSRLKKPILKLFSDYRNNPNENEPRDNHKIRVRDWIETELLKK